MQKEKILKRKREIKEQEKTMEFKIPLKVIKPKKRTALYKGASKFKNELTDSFYMNSGQQEKFPEIKPVIEEKRGRKRMRKDWKNSQELLKEYL